MKILLFFMLIAANIHANGKNELKEAEAIYYVTHNRGYPLPDDYFMLVFQAAQQGNEEAKTIITSHEFSQLYYDYLRQVLQKSREIVEKIAEDFNNYLSHN